MRLVLHTVICCCVFTTVLPLVKGATGEHNVSLKKRIRVWLQSHMKKDLVNSLLTATERYPDIQVRQEQDGEKTASPSLSSGLNSRPRRSASLKLTGCALFTCVYHDLLYLLHEINKKQKEATAPESKLGSKGYGRRRRRSLLYVTQLALQAATQGKSIGARCQVHRHTDMCTETGVESQRRILVE